MSLDLPSEERRPSGAMDPDFQEAFEAYKARDVRRKSMYIRPDVTAIDTSKTQTNMVLILGLIGAIISVVTAFCYYYLLAGDD